MNDLDPWVDDAAGLLGASTAGAVLIALAGPGPIRMASGADLASLARLPADRLALGPATLGGIVATRTSNGWRLVIADEHGAISSRVVRPAHRQPRPVPSEPQDLDAAALLWRLQHPGATRCGPVELLMRLLLWAWFDHPQRLLGNDDGATSVHDPGIACLAMGDVAGLAGLLDLELGPRVDADVIAALVDLVGHPPVPLTQLADGAEQHRLDVLNACLPTRWQLADELEAIDHRPDLALAVMAAPGPQLNGLAA